MSNFFKRFMTQRSRIFFFTILIAPLFFSACNSSSSDPLIVFGVESKPHVYASEGKVVGIDADIAKEAMYRAEIASEFRMSSSFSDAYRETHYGTNRAMLNVIYTKEEKDNFKWAGPTSKSSYHIFVKDPLKEFETIGVEKSKEIVDIAVVSGLAETIKLEELGFKNLKYYASSEEAINDFKNNKVKGIAAISKPFVDAISVDYYESEKIVVATTYQDIYSFIAFSKDVEDQVVSRCQDAIDSMVRDTTSMDILRKYDPRAVDRTAPGIMQLMTEISPPLNYISAINGAVVTFAGSSIEIVNEIQKRNGFKDTINVSGWIVGYAAAQYMPNYALFTMARTPERENLFQWVGPIASFKSNFYAMKDKNWVLGSINDAKAYKIATPQGWYTHDYLKDNGFTNILASSYTAEGAFVQFKDSEADILLLEDTDIDLYCEMYMIPRENIVKLLKAVDYEGYIAFSLDTSKTIVAQWQNNLDAMKTDGTFDKIFKK